MKTLWCDLETFSRIPITNGAHRYAEEVWVLLFGYAIDDEPAKVWDLTRQPQMPEDLKAALNNPEVNTVWHNGANFDSTVLRHAKNLRVDLPYERVDDCMVKAYSHGLPGSLGALCEVFNLPVDQAKDKDGHRLVLKFCKPDLKGEVHSYKTDPEDWERFVNYCRLDVEAMRNVYKKLPSWNWQAKDRAQFAVDQKVNNRGALMDVELAKAAIELAETLRKKNAKKTKDLTGGEVEAATQRDAMLQYILKQYGVSLPDLTKSTIERRLADENIPEEVKELLRVRLSSTKTSTAKYKKLIDCVNSDGRLRGCLQFRGAQRTGRFAGRLMQLQNLPRPSLNQWLIDMGYDAIKQGWADAVADPGELMASCLRGCIVAPKGSHLVVADLSNIEGRMLAWLAGEEWKLHAFRQFDAGKGPDLYKATYGRTFGIKPEDVTKHQRQIGKVMELALGYQGGVGAFLTFASAYSIDLNVLAEHVKESIATEYWNKAEGSYDWYKQKKLTHGLKRDTFIACEAVKLAWRAAHPAIKKFWEDIDTAAISAIHGVPAGAGRLWFDKKGSWLRMRLPSGRYVCYPGVSLEDGGVGAGTFSYMGMNQYSRKWERIRTYSGKCCLAKDTLVLTHEGWLPIQNVTAHHTVWDGLEWVKQEGAVCQGIKQVINAYGAFMTPDHKVLTEEGWKDASSCKRHNRAACGLPNSNLLRRFGREALSMEGSLRLRKGESDGPIRTSKNEEERDHSFLRLHARQDHRGQNQDPRNEQASGFRSLAFDEGKMRAVYTLGLQKLWRKGSKGLQTLVGIVREFLVGYGAYLCAGAFAGSNRQQWQLRTEQLSMGNGQRTGKQHPKNSIHQGQAAQLLGGEDRDWTNNLALQAKSWMSGRTPFRYSGHYAEVFDLVNCGPRHRFVVLAGGEPLVVHNCENATQATAADILIEAMAPIEAAGFRIVLSVHDEFITEAPLDKTHQELEKLMATPPAWARGLPLAAAGYTATRYRKD